MYCGGGDRIFMHAVLQNNYIAAKNDKMIKKYSIEYREIALFENCVCLKRTDFKILKQLHFHIMQL